MAGKILIVDDVATNRIVYKVKLGAACYAPILASDGASCLALARSEKPDLILLDLVLPDMSGTEVLRHLRADPELASIPVVVFSAEADMKARLAALYAGADDFLAKSVDDQTLMARLRNLLRGREAMAELESGAAPIRALGFAELASGFHLPGSIALVSHRPETALRWRHDLGAHLPDQMTMMSREGALSEVQLTPVPDVFIIESDLADPMGGLRLMSELRSRPQTRHAAICIVKNGPANSDAAMAFDLGADDVVSNEMDPREFGQRVARLLQRKTAADKLRASVRDGLRMAVIDPLTGLHNRRYAISQLAEIASRARSSKRPFALMVIDLDRFKQVNDTFGHPAGDAVLTEVARRLAANIRGGDLLARIGGEEFLIALPNTDLANANTIAQRLCRAMQEVPFDIPGFAPLDLTASIGLAICDNGQTWTEEPVAAVIERADQALLMAKSGGRNQVTISHAAA
ncbi:diguanylate cyclase [Pseudorhodobacter turbinis]|uniref:diguanylate cyclase n=1 Tax=Pseudorhodobacter turbinis TaxID=2500533 RepID=A0A4V1E0Z6_9RHOB|nr:diguanylate cyclase [Pseudorhodobacter turbinis]QCO56364.1 diguanylate cyclase [Pseudorhodobacter turbinis]